MYLAGVDLADCAFIYDIDTAKSTLFIPPIDPEGVMWTGLPLSAEEALEKYDVDAVLPTTELNPMLAKLGALNPKSTVFAIAERVATSVTFLEFGNKDFAILGEAIDECRVVKDDYEIALIKKANQISGAAHRAALENVRKAKNEYELEGVFVGKCIQQGAKKQAYPSIVASGRAAATLHYVHNDKPLAGKDLLLLDAGAEWSTYASDIVSIPSLVLVMEQKALKSALFHDYNTNTGDRQERFLYPAASPNSHEPFTRLSSRCKTSALKCSRRASFGTMSTCALMKSL